MHYQLLQRLSIEASGHYNFAEILRNWFAITHVGIHAVQQRNRNTLSEISSEQNKREYKSLACTQ